MSATAQGLRSAEERIRTQNYSFSQEKLKDRRDFHLRKIEKTLQATSPRKKKLTRVEQVKRYFGIA